MFFPAIATGAPLPVLAITPAQLACFLMFWGINMWIIWRGIDTIRVLLNIKAPLLIALGLLLLWWAWRSAGGFGPILSQPSAFDAGQARRFLEACAAAGLALRLHGDQFTEQGAIPLAVELRARSVDHLEATGDDGVRALAASDVVGVLLPASALFLGRPMPPARALVDAGAAIALASDFNPGSAFCESLPVVCSLACTQLRLSPGEALAACTVNAAHVLRRADRIGRLAPGYDANVVLLDVPDWRYLAYHLGGDVVAQVVVAGSRVWPS